MLFEGHAKNMREFMGLKGIRPHQIAAERELAERKEKVTAQDAKAASPARSRSKRTAAAAVK